VTSRGPALRVGLFALGGLFLLAFVVVVVAGSNLFGRSEQAVMHFRGSVYGLQIGSPVVFRGVRLGGVKSVGVVYSEGRFSVPVVVELERDRILNLGAASAPAGADAAEAVSLAALVAQGLVGQLSTHSLLTGQLYVDLSLRPGASANGPAVRRDAAGRIEIPTTPTRFQSLQDQLDSVDLARISDDLRATLAATRRLVDGPEIAATLGELSKATASLARVASTLDKRLGPLADSTQATLNQAAQASTRVGAAAERAGASAERAGTQVAQSAQQVGAAAQRAEALLQPGSPVLVSVQQAADELARSATALRSAISEDSATVAGVQRALADVSRASRAVRELAELLEQQPQSLLRGRPVQP